MRFPHTALQEQTEGILRAWGLLADHAGIAATAIGYADLAGIDSHGVSMLPTYEALLEAGKLAPQARPTTVRQTAVTALLDAGGGLGHPAGDAGMRLAVDKAATHGVAVVSVRNSRHFGAAGYYAALAAERGLIGLVTTTARSVCVTPTRGRTPRLPTNPLAFAAPAGRNRPYLLDMSTSTVAVNKVKVHGYTDQRLPGAWVRDASGAPVHDPHQAMRVIRTPGEGGLTPLGGTPEMASHKGYGLAMMVQVLSATLGGAAFGASRQAGPEGQDNSSEGQDNSSEGRAGSSDDVGHFFLALDPRAFRAEGEFEADLDDALDLLRATPAVDPALPVLVPGDPEAAASEERARRGVPVPDVLCRALRDICERAGAPFLLDESAAG